MTRFWQTSQRHRVSTGAVAALAPALAPAGMVLGDAPGVTCGWFGHQAPTRVALVGGSEVAQHVVLRALGVGAAVVVRSTRPTRWDALVAAVDLPRDLLAVVPRDGPVPAGGTSSRPLLVVDDLPSAESPLLASPDESAPGTWRCDLTVARALTTATTGPVRAADVVLVDAGAVQDLQPLVGMASARALPRAAELGGAGRVWVLAGDRARPFRLPEAVLGPRSAGPVGEHLRSRNRPGRRSATTSQRGHDVLDGEHP